MKRTLLILLFLASVATAHAQQQTAQKPKDPNVDVVIDSPIPMDTSKNVPYDPNRIFTVVEQEPVFPGGFQSFYKFLAKNVHYPASAVQNHIQGKVFVTFVVETDGSLTDMKVVKSVSPDIDAEAIRVLKSSPNWKPGLQNGKPVRIQFAVPIDFSLSAK
jgi:protein TonB